MTAYTIGEAADILGVTPKALRHWESLDLLQPERTSTGYRVYSDADLERGAAIALYQSIGIPLARIATLLDASSSHLARALSAHHEALRSRRDALEAQLQAVEEMMHKHKKDTLTMEDMKQYFGEEFPAYQEEAEKRWGHTPSGSNPRKRCQRSTRPRRNSSCASRRSLPRSWSPHARRASNQARRKRSGS